MRVTQIWTSIAEAGWDLVRSRLTTRRATPEQIATDLLSTRGDAVGTALAHELVEQLARADDETRIRFLKHLAESLGADREKILEAGDGYRSDPGARSLTRLRRAVEAPRVELFRRMNMAPNGIGALVTLREFLLRHESTHPELAAVDTDMQELLAGWLNPGFLSLVRIDWNSPASLLEKLIRYERVHRIANLEALRRRLGPDRRCFAFFHPALPDEPLIFVQVALVKGMAARVQPLIEDTGEMGNPDEADTAIFYSISNCLTGLRGISLGNFLIKLVVGELSRDLPSLRTFATLSPIPGFIPWCREAAEKGELKESDRLLVRRLSDPAWVDDAEFAAEARPRAEALCAHYLTRIKKNIRPRDPVARFHLNNGARLERLNWLGDISAKGLGESAGMLVNYRYDLDHIERNHEAYANEGTVVASSTVRALARQIDSGD